MFNSFRMFNSFQILNLYAHGLRLPTDSFLGSQSRWPCRSGACSKTPLTVLSAAVPTPMQRSRSCLPCRSSRNRRPLHRSFAFGERTSSEKCNTCERRQRSLRTLTVSHCPFHMRGVLASSRRLPPPSRALLQLPPTLRHSRARARGGCKVCRRVSFHGLRMRVMHRWLHCRMKPLLPLSTRFCPR